MYKNFLKSRISQEESEIFFKTELPLAGNFLSFDKIGSDLTFPLSLSFCKKTASIQVNESINPDILFKKYLYKTGTANTLVNHFKKTSKLIIDKINPKSILDLGCNDFTFLKNFKGISSKILGVDPSNISIENKPEYADLKNTFFNFDESEKIKDEYGTFDTIFSSNNFAHIEDIRDYTRGISNILSENGNFICEVHWVGTLIKNIQFPFIYHEHLYYYTLKSLIYLLNEYNLYVNDIDEIDIHGGSIRIWASKKNVTNKNVLDFIEKEKLLKLYEYETYKNFSKKINELKIKTRNLFDKLKKENKLVYGYGASGQANTLMSIFELNNSDLLYIIDDSDIKNGLYTPKNYIQIKDNKFLNDNKPDCIYVLAYTFIDEIKKRNQHLDVEWIPAI